MIVCRTCGGRGEELTPGWYHVQLYELGAWSDYLDYETLAEAIAKAEDTKWGVNVRVRRHGRVVWRGDTGDLPNSAGLGVDRDGVRRTP